MVDRFPVASTELAIQLLGEASLFLDDFCISNDISLKVAIAMTMATANAKGGYDTARAMETALNIIISQHSLKRNVDIGDRRRKDHERSRHD